MFTELLQAESWMRKLVAAGFRVSMEPYEYRPVGLNYCVGCDRLITRCRCAVKR